MLKVWAYHPIDSNYVLDIDRGYPLCACKSWYNKYAIKAIEEIDGNRYIGDGVSESSVLGIISPDWLSGGTKTLIFSMNNPDVVCPLANLGDDCAHILNLISKEYDIVYTYIFSTFVFEKDQEIYCMETNKIVHGYEEYLTYRSDIEDDVAQRLFHEGNLARL